MSDVKTCKKGTELFAIKRWAIVTHDLLGSAFYTEQLCEVVLQVGKAGALDLKQEGKFTEVITD